MPLTLSPQVFSITAHLIEERTGLHYDASSIDVLAERLSERAADLGLESLLDYYYYLRYDPRGDDETRTLAEALVVQETYLFREVDPLRVLVRSILPAMLRARPPEGGAGPLEAPIRIWSAACATGEEPYTLALMIRAAGLHDAVEIVASDISERSLVKARAGTYAGRSLRSLPADDDDRCGLEVSDGCARIPDDVRALIAWRRVNLVNAVEVQRLGMFDVVLCRNVLIYFAEQTVARVAGNIGSVMRADGVLVVGSAESLLRFGTLFECEERGGAFFYRKRGA